MRPPYEQAPQQLAETGRVRRLLSSAVAPAGTLHHVARCTDGVPDTTVDAADHTADHTAGHDALLLIDQQLSLAATRLERQLAPARSGNLIRMVTQAGRGAFFCDSVVPGVHLIGALLARDAPQPGPNPAGRPEVDRGDEELGRLASELRRLISLGSQDPGGFEHHQGPASRPNDGPVRIVGTGQHRLSPLVRAALSPDDLHYLAYYEGADLSFSVDILDHADLAEFFGGIPIATRRRFYQEFGREFGPIAGELGRVVAPLIGGPLTRVVLDVEQGALYHLRVRRGEYLVGVTLNQRRVSHADARIGRLAAECSAESPLATPDAD
jgi:hypothetical protein